VLHAVRVTDPRGAAVRVRLEWHDRSARLEHAGRGENRVPCALVLSARKKSGAACPRRGRDGRAAAQVASKNRARARRTASRARKQNRCAAVRTHRYTSHAHRMCASSLSPSPSVSRDRSARPLLLLTGRNKDSRPLWTLRAKPALPNIRLDNKASASRVTSEVAGSTDPPQCRCRRPPQGLGVAHS